MMEFMTTPPKQRRKRAKAPTVFTPKQIRAIRTRLGLTRARFGQRIGVSAKTVQYYELGMQKPSQAVILHLESLGQ
jgi:DNA-binding transcriptional regulator YiaG